MHPAVQLGWNWMCKTIPFSLLCNPSYIWAYNQMKAKWLWVEHRGFKEFQNLFPHHRWKSPTNTECWINMVVQWKPNIVRKDSQPKDRRTERVVISCRFIDVIQLSTVPNTTEGQQFTSPFLIADKAGIAPKFETIWQDKLWLKGPSLW